jgi:imidazolonepropionase-like amidohydrolase
MVAVARFVGCAAFALALLLSTEAAAQRADAFNKTVKAFVTADQRVILIKDARLLDGVHWQAAEHQDMLVRDGRIAAVGGTIAAPAGAKIIDAHGQTLMPGLITVHEHLMTAIQVGERPAFRKSLRAAGDARLRDDDGAYRRGRRSRR